MLICMNLRIKFVRILLYLYVDFGENHDEMFTDFAAAQLIYTSFIGFYFMD